MNEFKINGVTYEFINELYDSKIDRYRISHKMNGKYERMLRSKWVWITHYMEDIPKGYILHHINKNHKHDTIDNLQLVTRGEHNKLHADDVNHYMFREGHSYWNHPKSEQHKARIKDGHLKRNMIEYNRLYNIAAISIYDNPEITMEQLIKKLGRKSHKVFRRIFNTTFKLLKQEILGKQLNVSEVMVKNTIDSPVQYEQGGCDI